MYPDYTMHAVTLLYHPWDQRTKFCASLRSRLNPSCLASSRLYARWLVSHPIYSPYGVLYRAWFGSQD